MKQIKEASDVTPEMIEEAADMRSGLYGGYRLGWGEIVDRLETSDTDWGSSMESPAIKHLQRSVRERLRKS